MEAKFTTFHVLPMTPKLKRLQDTFYKEVLAFVRFKTHNPKLQDLTTHPELETLCDCLTLIRSGAIELEYTDCMSDGVGEGIVVRLNLE